MISEIFRLKATSMTDYLYTSMLKNKFEKEDFQKKNFDPEIEKIINPSSPARVNVLQRNLLRWLERNPSPVPYRLVCGVVPCVVSISYFTGLAILAYAVGRPLYDFFEGSSFDLILVSFIVFAMIASIDRKVFLNHKKIVQQTLCLSEMRLENVDLCKKIESLHQYLDGALISENQVHLDLQSTLHWMNEIANSVWDGHIKESLIRKHKDLFCEIYYGFYHWGNIKSDELSFPRLDALMICWKANKK